MIWFKKRPLLSYALLGIVVLYTALRLFVELSLSPEVPPGRFIQLGEHSVHLVCHGEGQNTVLFESGFGSDAYSSWDYIASQLSDKQRACYYDRLGTGWSDAAPAVYTTDHKALLLSQVVAQLNSEAQLVLVAHSYGGIIARKAISQFAAKVDKLVLVDSAHEEQHARLTPWLSPLSKRDYYLALANGVFGVGKIAAVFSGGTIDRLSAYYSGLDYARVVGNYVADGGFFTPLIQADVHLNNIPLLVLEHDPKAYPDVERWGEANLVWLELQEELASLSLDSQKVMVSGATHDIPGDKPDALVAYLQAFISS